jgi:hypothetical protein
MPEAAAIGVIVSDLQRSVGPSLPIGAPSGGYRVAIAFERDSPEDVDRVYGELLDAGGAPHKDRGMRSGANATARSRTPTEP